MPKTSLHLRLDIWGAKVDPDLLTNAFLISPSMSFQVGESRGQYAQDKAAWQWESEEAGSDVEELFATFVGLFLPHEAVIQECVSDGAEVVVSISGFTEVGVVDTPEEADRRQYEVPEPFEQFSDADRVALFVSAAALRFLSSISACLQTHVDILLEGEDGGRHVA